MICVFDRKTPYRSLLYNRGYSGLCRCRLRGFSGLGMNLFQMKFQPPTVLFTV